MEPNNDRPPLKSIEVNGTYKLKLIKPKFEKVKHNEDGTSSPACSSSTTRATA